MTNRRARNPFNTGSRGPLLSYTDARYKVTSPRNGRSALIRSIAVVILLCLCYLSLVSNDPFLEDYSSRSNDSVEATVKESNEVVAQGPSLVDSPSTEESAEEEDWEDQDWSDETPEEDWENEESLDEGVSNVADGSDLDSEDSSTELGTHSDVLGDSDTPSLVDLTGADAISSQPDGDGDSEPSTGNTASTDESLVEPLASTGASEDLAPSADLATNPDSPEEALPAEPAPEDIAGALSSSQESSPVVVSSEIIEPSVPDATGTDPIANEESQTTASTEPGAAESMSDVLDAELLDTETEDAAGVSPVIDTPTEEGSSISGTIGHDTTPVDSPGDSTDGSDFATAVAISDGGSANEGGHTATYDVGDSLTVTESTVVPDVIHDPIEDSGVMVKPEGVVEQTSDLPSTTPPLDGSSSADQIETDSTTGEVDVTIIEDPTATTPSGEQTESSTAESNPVDGASEEEPSLSSQEGETQTEIAAPQEDEGSPVNSTPFVEAVTSTDTTAQVVESQTETVEATVVEDTNSTGASTPEVETQPEAVEGIMAAGSEIPIDTTDMGTEDSEAQTEVTEETASTSDEQSQGADAAVAQDGEGQTETVIDATAVGDEGTSAVSSPDGETQAASIDDPTVEVNEAPDEVSATSPEVAGAQTELPGVTADGPGSLDGISSGDETTGDGTIATSTEGGDVQPDTNEETPGEDPSPDSQKSTTLPDGTVIVENQSGDAVTVEIVDPNLRGSVEK